MKLVLEGKTKPTAYYIGLILIAAVLTFFGGVKFARAAQIDVQLFTLEENTQQVGEFPFGKKYVIALVSETEDLTKHLPITLTVRHARVTATDRIPNDPAKYCKDIHVCALQGPIISPKGSQTAIEITALGNDGKTLATFTQGTVPSKDSKTAAQVLPDDPKLTEKVTSLAGDPAPSPLRDPWVIGLLGVFIISALGAILTLRKKE